MSRYKKYNFLETIINVNIETNKIDSQPIIRIKKKKIKIIVKQST